MNEDPSVVTLTPATGKSITVEDLRRAFTRLGGATYGEALEDYLERERQRAAFKELENIILIGGMPRPVTTAQDILEAMAEESERQAMERRGFLRSDFHGALTVSRPFQRFLCGDDRKSRRPLKERKARCKARKNRRQNRR